MSTSEVPEVVERNAPIISLHPKEKHPVVIPDAWLENAKLFWFDGDASSPVFDGSAFELFTTNRDFRSHDRALNDITRPWDSSRPPGPRASGFSLTTGIDPRRSSTPSEERVPLFYEHVEDEYVTYWLFFPWSTVPRGIPSLRAGPEALSPEQRQREAELATALEETYPELVEAATPPAGPEGLGRRELLRFVIAYFGSKWPFLHEGDWEGVSVSLLPAADRRVAYFQHGKPQERVLGEDVRPRVYVALGSHASYPDVDPGSPGSPRIKGFEELRENEGVEYELIDVLSQSWYGFGGAWGAPGPISDETGPLGPCAAKGPRPFALR